MQIVWQRANKLEFNYKLIFKECFMLMICIQVTNAMKDDIAPVIHKIYKEMEPVWGEMFMVGSGQKSETNKTEIKHMRRHKRLMLLVDWKLTGKTWNGYTDWTNTGSFLMDCQMSPQQRLMTSFCHWPLPLTSATRTEMPDRRTRAQSMHLPAWAPTGSALEGAPLVPRPRALKCWHPPWHWSQHTKMWEIFLGTRRTKFI